MRFFVALAMAVCAMGTVPAHATDSAPAPQRSQARITGTYVVTSTAKAEALGLYDTAGSATWSFDGAAAQRVLPATLTAAAYGPFVTACTSGGDGTVTEQVAGPGADPAAGLDFAIIADLLRNRTGATIRVLPDSGYARETTDRECTGEFAVGNGVTSRDVSAGAMFANGTVGYDRWPMRLDGSGHWRVDGVQTASSGDGSSRAEVHAVMNGTLKELHAACTVPTVKQLRRVHSFGQGAAVLARAGFGKPHTGVVHIAWAPRGHYYVDEIGDTELMPCGARLHLYRS